MLQFVSCSACETRQWFQDGAPVDLDEVLLAVGEKTEPVLPHRPMARVVGPEESFAASLATELSPAAPADSGATTPGVDSDVSRADELRQLLERRPEAAPGGPADESKSRSELVESLTMPISLQDLASVLAKTERSAA